MLFVKIIGILFLCSLAATDMITLKPFLKSRYSLRERRAKSTTRAPLIKTNDTVLNYSTTSEAETQSFSTVAPTQLLETTKAFTEKQLEDTNDQSTAVNAISTTHQVTTTEAALITAPMDKISTSTSQRELVNLENEVTEKIFVTDTTTLKKLETTTQTEWLYDYYASEDENPKRETSA